jgi:hypothetical protein
MRQILLERIIRKLLVEQTSPLDYSDVTDILSNKTIRGEFEPTGEDDPRKRIIIKDAPDVQITYAEGYGAVNAFRVVFRTTKEGKDLVNNNNLIDLLRDSILKHPQLGAGSKYDNGNYMYVFSENQSIKQRQVYNVWILDYAKLQSIAKSINDAEQSSKLLRKFSGIPDVNAIAWFMADKIPVLTYKSAVQWLSLMQNKAKQYSLVLRDPSTNKPYKFPDLTKMNRKTVDVTPIVDQRFEEIERGAFIGTVKVTLDANGNEQREYYKGSLVLATISSREQKDYAEFDGEFKNGYPYKGTLTKKDANGNIISVWQGEVKDGGDDGLVPVTGKGKYTKTIKYPKEVKIEDKPVSIENVIPETGYVYGYVNDRFIKINQTDFEDYYTLPENDPARKMYTIEDVTDEETINKLKTKIKIPEKKNVPVIVPVTTQPGVISYPYTVKWFQINGAPVVVYKLTDDDPDVYYYNSTGAKSWYSINREQFESFDKATPKKQENSPKQTKLTDAAKIAELNTIAGIKTTSVSPPQKPKKEQPKPEQPKKEVWKSGDKLIPIKDNIDVYERSGNTFTKQTSRRKSEISDIKFKWYTGGKYAYVDINYNDGDIETYYVLKTDVKKL